MCISLVLRTHLHNIAHCVIPKSGVLNKKEGEYVCEGENSATLASPTFKAFYKIQQMSLALQVKSKLNL